MRPLERLFQCEPVFSAGRMSDCVKADAPLFAAHFPSRALPVARVPATCGGPFLRFHNRRFSSILRQIRFSAARAPSRRLMRPFHIQVLTTSLGAVEQNALAGHLVFSMRAWLAALSTRQLVAWPPRNLSELIRSAPQAEDEPPSTPSACSAATCTPAPAAADLHPTKLSCPLHCCAAPPPRPAARGFFVFPLASASTAGARDRGKRENMRA